MIIKISLYNLNSSDEMKETFIFYDYKEIIIIFNWIKECYRNYDTIIKI